MSATDGDNGTNTETETKTEAEAETDNLEELLDSDLDDYRVRRREATFLVAETRNPDEVVVIGVEELERVSANEAGWASAQPISTNDESASPAFD